jgi:hypothetical protein
MARNEAISSNKNKITAMSFECGTMLFLREALAMTLPAIRKPPTLSEAFLLIQ